MIGEDVRIELFKTHAMMPVNKKNKKRKKPTTKNTVQFVYRVNISVSTSADGDDDVGCWTTDGGDRPLPP